MEHLMKFKDLPDDDREEMYAYLRDAGCFPAEVEDFSIDELL
jgi:hypothetical protein